MEDLVEDARSSFEQAATTLVDQIRSALVDERTGKNAFQLAVEQAQQFYQAVDWSERWLQALVATECFLLILVLVTRNRTTFQGILFVILGKLRNSSKPQKPRTTSSQAALSDQTQLTTVCSLQGP